MSARLILNLPFSLPGGAPLVDELDDADGDRTEQEDVYEAFLAQHEFSHEPRGEECRGQQTDVQVFSPGGLLQRLTSRPSSQSLWAARPRASPSGRDRRRPAARRR